jgi:hypothetical protein
MCKYRFSLVSDQVAYHPCRDEEPLDGRDVESARCRAERVRARAQRLHGGGQNGARTAARGRRLRRAGDVEGVLGSRRRCEPPLRCAACCSNAMVILCSAPCVQERS